MATFASVPVILIGDSGTGKTMLATGLAICACQQGRRVRFTTLAGLANELQEAQSGRELARVVGRYARTELAKLAESVRAQGVAVTERLAQGTPSAEIIRIAKEEPVDLIVLGSHGKGLLDHALFGSTTERVVRKAPCPVLTCRPKKPADKA